MEINENLVAIFEGGGSKGFAHTAPIKRYNEIGEKPKFLMGVSAGTFPAVLTGLDFSSEEFESLLAQKTKRGKSIFTTFKDKRKFKLFNFKDYDRSRLKQALENSPLASFFKIPYFGKLAGSGIFHFWIRIPGIGHIYKEKNFGGLYQGEKLREWILGILQERLQLDRPTMRDFYQKTGCFLIICATDLDINGNKFLVLTPESAPFLPVDVAVSMSTRIPGYYEFLRWRNDFGKYGAKFPIDLTGHRIVDGGLISNAPLSQVYAWNKEQFGEIPEDLEKEVYVIDETLPVCSSGTETGKTEVDRESFRSFATEIFNASLSSDEIVLSSEKVKHEVIRLPAMGYSALEFDMNEERRSKLIKAAEKAVKNHFKE